MMGHQGRFVQLGTMRGLSHLGVLRLLSHHADTTMTYGPDSGFPDRPCQVQKGIEMLEPTCWVARQS